VKTTLGALLPKLRQNGSDEHLQKSIDHYRKTREHLDDLATEGEPEKPIHPNTWRESWTSSLPKTRSSPATWGLDGLGGAVSEDEWPRRLLGSFNHGSMANAMHRHRAHRRATPAGR